MPPKHELGDWHRTLSEIVETMSCGFLVRARDGRVIYANDCLLRWLGYERSEVEDKPVHALLPEELHDVVEEELRAIEAGDLRVRLTVFRRKDSTTVPMLLIPQRLTDAEGRVVGGFSVLVELGSVQTAKPAGYGSPAGLRAGLDRVLMEIQSLALSASLAPELTLPTVHADLESLSPREREVLVPLVNGERVPSIARRLHISPHTVRNHLKAIYRKLGVGSQAELIERFRS